MDWTYLQIRWGAQSYQWIEPGYKHGNNVLENISAHPKLQYYTLAKQPQYYACNVKCKHYHRVWWCWLLTHSWLGPKQEEIAWVQWVHDSWAHAYNAMNSYVCDVIVFHVWMEYVGFGMCRHWYTSKAWKHTHVARLQLAISQRCIFWHIFTRVRNSLAESRNLFTHWLSWLLFTPTQSLSNAVSHLSSTLSSAVTSSVHMRFLQTHSIHALISSGMSREIVLYAVPFLNCFENTWSSWT